MRLCALALCSLLFSGCALFSKDDGTEPVELVEFEPTVELDVRWKTGVGDGTEGKVVKLSPSLQDGALYAASFDGVVVAVDTESGDRLWRRKTDDAISGGVGTGAERVLYGTRSGEVVALSRDNGEELWRQQLTSEVVSSPQTDGERVAVQSIDGKLFALNAQSGEILWQYENQPPVLTLRGTASPLMTGSAVIAAFANGKVMAFDPDNGLTLWERRVALPQGRSEIERMVDVDATPVLVNSTVYLASYQGNVMAVSASSGRPLWSQEASTHNDVAVADRTLFLSQADSVVRALSTTTGETRWENDQLLRRHINGPQVMGDYIAVGDYDGYLHLLNQSDGAFAARDRLDRGGISGQMVTDGSALYVQTDDGDLFALEIKPLD
ncbi:outer membrane protein assembly factor BamB [Marinimicrobium agarilyticum]|uniref:outer membrane protein assembly factor BamB n=1 Tax=Marinimicrobium agarilyticum TaxID=306546 RepID=UPI0004069675|nr:outer membrane protein assembly factor BamB [Marinimicrobium agarilyticum]